MTSDFDTVLEDCLERLAQGETLQLCLERYPNQAGELKPLLQAAARLEEQSQLRPSLAFKSRTRAKLYAHMDAHPRQRGQQWKRLLFPFSRMAVGLATLAMTFALTGTALAQSALPGGSLYSWKLTSERTWRAVSPDPLSFDLSLAERRVDELVAVSGNPTAQETAIKEYNRVVTDLEHYQDATVQARIQQTLKTQQERLQNAGFLIEDPGMPTPTSIVPSPTLTPVSIQTIVPSPQLTVIPTTLAPSQIIPTRVLPTIKVPTGAPATIKVPTGVLPTIKAPTVVPTIIKKPTVLLPTIKIPTIALPTINIPTIDLPDIPGLP